MEFKVGDIVEWESQAGGKVRKKEGEVVEIIPAGVQITIILDKRGYHYSRRNFDGSPRNHKSYLILTREGRLYWPRVNRLRKVKDEKQ